MRFGLVGVYGHGVVDDVGNAAVGGKRSGGVWHCQAHSMTMRLKSSMIVAPQLTVGSQSGVLGKGCNNGVEGWVLFAKKVVVESR